MNDGARIELACIRLQRILGRLRIATMRTLEQKISDAGPSGQRIDPHNLSKARQQLQDSGIVTVEMRADIPWYRLASMPEREWRERLALVEPLLRKLNRRKNSLLVGQVLEIAVFRALCSERARHGMEFFGGYPNLDPSDETTWRKIEPSMISGRSLAGDRNLDFALSHRNAGIAGVEVKNTREWVYPHSEEILDLLGKCCKLDAVPVMICRRYAYATFSVLHRCGVVLHQNYNQLLPESMRDVAEQARHKDLLGYHDIRLGTNPDPRLRRFISIQLPDLLPEARERFDQYKDLLGAFASREMSYEEFTARARRRELGMPEDFDRNTEHE